MYKFPIRIENSLQVSVFVAGFTAIIVQLLFIRSFLSLLNGNELMIGIVLCNWMLLTAAGAILGKMLSANSSALVAVHIFTGLLPPTVLFMIYFLKVQLFAPGVELGLGDSFLFTFFTMAFFCLPSGALFTLLSKSYSHSSLQNKTTLVYALEAIGGVLGGLLFSLLMINFFRIPEILILLTSANFTVAILLSLAFEKKKYTHHLIFIGLLTWIMFHFMVDWHSLVKSLHYPNQKYLYDTETPFGNVVITRSGKQLNVFENGTPLFSSNEPVHLEESVHFAMLQVETPKKVLVISGNITGQFNELKKYDIEHLDFVEPNPFLIKLQEKYFGLPDEALASIHNIDPVEFIRRSKEKYDVIILNLYPPSSLQSNRFYTADFFALLKNICSPKGVISLKLEGNSNYLGEDLRRLYSVILTTIKSVFSEVIIIPGQSNYLLASNSPLTYKIGLSADSKNLNNQHLNGYYLDDESLERRGKELLASTDAEALVNRDFKPIAYYYRIGYWLSWYHFNLWWVIGIAGGIFLIVFLIISPPAKAMFVAGFTATSIEMMVLLTFQIMFGFLYETLALLLSAFMAGLAGGALLQKKYAFQPLQKALLLNHVMIALSALLIPLLILIKDYDIFPDFSYQISLFLTMILSGLLTGINFAIANTMAKGSTGNKASAIYGADLSGSAGGAIFAAILLIPILYISNTGLFLAAINILMVLWLLFHRKEAA